MSNMRMIISNIIDAATSLTATSEDLPISNIQNQLRGTAWKSTTDATQIITANFAAQGASGFSIARSNLSATGTIRVQLLLSGTMVYDSGAVNTAVFIPAGVWRAGVDPFGATFNDKLKSNIRTLWFDTVICDQMILTIDDTANPDNFISIERVFLGFAFKPQINPAYGLTLNHSQGFRHIRTAGGASVTVGNDVTIRSMTIDLEILMDADRDYLETELNISGANNDLLISIYPNQNNIREIQHTMICVREPNIAFAINFLELNSTSLLLTEV